MNRLYLSALNVETVKAVTDDVLKLSIERKNIQIVAEDLQQLKEKQLPTVNLFNRTNIPRAFESGALLGLLAGTLLALLLIMIAPGGEQLSTLLFLQVVFAVAFMAALSGFVIGWFQDNHHLKEYRNRLDRGECIIELKVDAATSRRVKNLLLQQYPEVEVLREDLDVCYRTISERAVKAV